MNQINIVNPIVEYANKKITLEQLGLQIAEVIDQHPDLQQEPRLLRIRNKFATVESLEKFDAFLNDLVYWCQYADCDLLIPSKP